MNKNNKHKLIPKLRFPEFQNAGEWEVKKVGDILVESKIPLKINDLEKRITVRLNLKGVEKREYRGTESENATYFFERKKGQFIYGKQNLHKGAFGIIPEELDGYASSQDLPAFDFKNGFFPKFFLHYLSQETVYPELEKIATGTGSKRIHPKEFYNVSIPVPSLPEQQKIASCLSSLDEVITGEQQKLELLKQHKKGLLQNLFPQEGETLPKLRFKEFENSGEWVVKKLGEIAHFLKGKGISKADVDSKGKLPCIRYGELYTHYGEIIKEIKSFTNLREDDLMLSEPNDVIIPSSGETKEDIATASCVKLGGVALGGDLNILRTSLNGDFLAYYLSNGLKKVISKIAQGDAVVHLYATQLKKLTIGVPSMKEEQEKIASCLSSLDEVITAQTQKIEQLQRHKKGLLQGLFPNINNE